MVMEIWVNVGSGNGLMPDGTKPLPQPMLTSHWWARGSVILTSEQFHTESAQDAILFKEFESYSFEITYWVKAKDNRHKQFP